MMPKPTESEKKIWPYAAIHTDESVSAPQSGVNRASRPAPDPSRNSARMTTAMNRSTSTGTKNCDVAPMPFCTPKARIAMTTIHVISSGHATPAT